MKRAAVISLLALIATLALAGTASGAFYAGTREASRPDSVALHIEVTVRNGFIKRIRGTAPQYCRGFNSTGLHFDYPGLDVRIQPDGHFRFVERQRLGGGIRTFDALIGRISGNRLRGRFGSRSTLRSQGISCWTGRSYEDPWMRIVARRRQRS